MTDFLDQLEDELRVAAEHRGQPRRRRPTGALKVVAAVAVVALAVVGATRLENDSEQAASPTPGPTEKVAYATSGDPELLSIVSARSRGFIWTDIPEGRNTADASLGSIVLYRPGAEELADRVAFTTKLEARPITPADEQRIDVDVSRADVIVVYGREADERMLADPEICAPSGGALKLCVDRSDAQRYSVLVLDDRPLTAQPDEGWWSWAALAPDGRNILVQQEGDCPSAAMIPAQDGEPRSLGDGQALGWTTDGRAIVKAGCDGKDGTFLVSPAGPVERIAGADAKRSHSPQEIG